MNFWRHTKIITNGQTATEITIPSTLTNEIIKAEQEVKEDSNFLVKLGDFHAKNMMSLNELLNSHKEGNLEQWSLEEIFSSTLAEDSAAHNGDSQGQGDGENELIFEKPSGKASQKAIHLLMKFISNENSQEADSQHHSLESYSHDLDYSLLKNSQQMSIQHIFDPASFSLNK
ncbi:hypothetical protein O181_091729 [Austropuccinia psidii MF-1]|uniref:Uncharacterized protein n=1 Tax=Austropuccinia psidii MF-1 TaxID=1389203 RepID=A0A9Q3IXX2_9BASI|nr:hypothetical protein [Austropuccinia psidii MF-1]